MGWQDTEKECFEYLQNLLKEFDDVSVISEGKSDSTKPDISIFLNDENIFNIEVKESSCQAGQFVIFEESNKWYFSKRNKCNQQYCQPIIDYINNYMQNLTVSQNGIDIDCDKQIQYERIKEFYINEKSSTFFITKYNNEFIVFETKNLENYFDINCILRRKKSGSRDVNKKIEQTVKSYIIKYLKSFGINEDKYVFVHESGHLLLFFSKNIINLHHKKIKCDNFNIYFSESKNSNEYRISLLSSTNNPNIIFEMNLKNNIAVNEKDKLIKEIEKYMKNIGADK